MTYKIGCLSIKAGYTPTNIYCVTDNDGNWYYESEAEAFEAMQKIVKDFCKGKSAREAIYEIIDRGVKRAILHIGENNDETREYYLFDERSF